MSKKFDPEAIGHIKSQNERIEDVGKARSMAETTNTYHNIASAYERYQADPASVQDERMAAGFKYLSEAGVPSDYIRRVGELQGEEQGVFYDEAIKAKTRSNWFPFMRGVIYELITAHHRKEKEKFGEDVSGEPADAPSYLTELARSPEYLTAQAKEAAADHAKGWSYSQDRQAQEDKRLRRIRNDADQRRRRAS